MEPSALIQTNIQTDREEGVSTIVDTKDLDPSSPTMVLDQEPGAM